MNILALDLGGRVGWAAGNASAPFLVQRAIDSGVQDLRGESRGESQGMKYIRFRRWLADMADLVQPALIAYEQFYLRGLKAETAELFTNQIGRVQELCAERKLEYTAVNGMTLKKWVTGSGRAKKHEMITAVSKRWKIVRDENEADAIAVLHYVIETRV